MSKKIVCLLLAVMLCMGLLPFGAFAEAEEETVIGAAAVLGGGALVVTKKKQKTSKHSAAR